MKASATLIEPNGFGVVVFYGDRTKPAASSDPAIRWWNGLTEEQQRFLYERAEWNHPTPYRAKVGLWLMRDIELVDSDGNIIEENLP